MIRTNSNFRKFVKALLLTQLIAWVQFFRILDFGILNPNNSNWLKGGDLGALDLAQSTLAQFSYIQQPTHWPIYELVNIGTYFKTSLIFNDAVPIFTYLLKIAIEICNYDFGLLQFVGLEIFTSLSLLALASYYLMIKISSDTLISFMFSWLLTSSPGILLRVFAPSLTYQFVIVVALVFCWKRLSLAQSTKITDWPLIIFFTALIHSYFLPIIFFIMICSLEFRSRELVNNCKRIGYSLLAAIVGTYFAGGFSAGVNGPKSGISGIGPFSSDLFSILNSRNISKWIPGLDAMPSIEGYSYPGIGILLLNLFVLIHMMKNRKISVMGASYKFIKRVYLVTIALYIIAIGPHVTYLNHTFWLTQNRLLIFPWNIFHSSGRFAMIVPIVLTLLPIVYLLDILSIKKLRVAIVLLCLIQTLEFSGITRATQLRFHELTSQKPDNLSARLQKAMTSNDQIIFYPSNPSPDVVPWQNLVFSNLEENSNVKIINFAYMNRYDIQKVTKAAIKTEIMFKNGNLPRNSLIIAKTQDLKWNPQPKTILDRIGDWTIFEIPELKGR